MFYSWEDRWSRTSIGGPEVRHRFSEHDLRQTFETVAESLNISYYTLKRLLNHKTSNDPTAGYILMNAAYPPREY
jgi:integrase